MGYFNALEQEQIKQAIGQAEHLSSGEIRVCVEKKCTSPPIERAAHFFHKLKMGKTAHKNGVLIYIASESKHFAIIGDSGIHLRTGDDFWESVKKIMFQRFSTGEILLGVTEAIDETGKKLKEFFPIQDDDKNELADDVYDKG